jgi:hypothetical protein
LYENALFLAQFFILLLIKLCFIFTLQYETKGLPGMGYDTIDKAVPNIDSNSQRFRGNRLKMFPFRGFKGAAEADYSGFS